LAMDKIIGYTNIDIDATFSTVRTTESQFGNFLTDLLRIYS